MISLSEMRALVREVWRDFFSSLFIQKKARYLLPRDFQPNLDAVMNWLRAAAAHGQGGVSSHFRLVNGTWSDPFPETTGYIIPTLYEYAQRSGRAEFSTLAGRLADWLADVQMPDGACIQGTWAPGLISYKPIVFNTGQNIFGFLKAFRETKKKRFLDAAIKAGRFLINATDDKGLWIRALHHGIPHTYNTRTAWALLELNRIDEDEEYVHIARSNLDWAVEQQHENGWFSNAGFKPGELPNTHGIAYTLRGLVEAGLIMHDKRYINPVIKTLEHFSALIESGRVPFTFWDENWRNHGKYLSFMKGRYVCLTGIVQLAIVWMRLFQQEGDRKYLEMSDFLLAFALSTQNLKSPHEGIRGGIKGAYPVYGSYSMLKYPNWAAKFTADAIMLRLELKNNES